MPRKKSAAKPAESESLIKLDIPLPDEGVGSEDYWAQEIESSDDRLKKEIPNWRGLIERYKGARPKLPGVRPDDVINVNVGFYTVEQKKPQLAFQVPDVIVTSLRPDTTQVAPLVQAIVNEQLGRDNINASALIDEVLSYVLIPAGVGPSKIGFDRVSVEVPVPTQRLVDGPPDPITGLATQTLALDPKTGKPETTLVKKTIFQKWYWNSISPAMFLRPNGFTSTQFDQAPWLGFKNPADETQLKADYGIDAGSLSEIGIDQTLMSDDDRKAIKSLGYVIEIWYRASLFDPSERNPERIRQLVILPSRKNKGATVLVHRN